jgi:phosphomannomutase
LAPLNRYFSTGEINTTVADPLASIARVKDAFSETCEIDELDGVTVTAPEWWFNVRASNTEPLLRLNAEATTTKELKKVRDRVLALIG